MSQTSDESPITVPSKNSVSEPHAPLSTPQSSSEVEASRVPDETFEETPSSLVLRSVFALLAGVFLLWAQHKSKIDTHTEWSRWIWMAVVCNFVLPVGIVWMFFAQGFTHVPWFKDQKHNAWGYGFSFRNWRRHFSIAGVLVLAMLPFLFYFSRDSQIQSFYREYFPPIESTPALLFLLLSLVIYMFVWEWFFRGFLLFGFAQGFGVVVAILLQAALFGFAHWGKPPLEMYSSFAGGAILGFFCWREKSFAPAFYTHALIHLVWAALILL